MSLLNKTNKSKEDIVETRRRNKRDEKLYYKSYPRINDIFTAIWHYLYWTPPRHLSPPIHVENLDKTYVLSTREIQVEIKRENITYIFLQS